MGIMFLQTTFAPGPNQQDESGCSQINKAQIRKIKGKLEQRGFTFVPLRIYFNSRGLAKLELALATGKRQYDKRKTIAEKQQKRDIDRSIKKYR